MLRASVNLNNESKVNMQITKETVKGLKAPNLATHVQLKTTDGKTAVVPLKDIDTLVGADGELTFGRLNGKNKTTFVAATSDEDMAEMVKDTVSHLESENLKPDVSAVRTELMANYGFAPTDKEIEKIMKQNKKSVKAPKASKAKSEKTPKTKTPKAPKAKREAGAPRNGHGDVFGFSVASAARCLGAKGWFPSDAIVAIHSKVPKASEAAIRTYVQAGKQGVRGEPAKLTVDQIAELRSAVKAVEAKEAKAEAKDSASK